MNKLAKEEDLLPWLEPEQLLTAMNALREDQIGVLRDALARLAEHWDEDVRDASLRNLLIVGKRHEYRPFAVKALRNDEAPFVRGTAALGLSAVSTPETREEDLRELLNAFLSDEEDIEVRGAAYEALLIMHKRPAFPPGARAIDLSKDVDWAWVDRLRNQVKGVGTRDEDPW